MSETDFWWLEEKRRRSLYVGVGHSKPSTYDEQPLDIPWFHSLEDGSLSAKAEHYALSFIRQWRNACNDINVYRTLTLFDEDRKPILIGPFWIDIDNENEDLEDALEVARRTVVLLTDPRGQLAIQDDDLRVLFSGHKGFHIEVRPSSLGINIADPVADQIRRSRTWRCKIIYALQKGRSVGSSISAVGQKGTVIDPIYGGSGDPLKLKHEDIRLHGSINQWIEEDGNKMARRKILLSLAELFRMSAGEICQKARYGVSMP